MNPARLKYEMRHLGLPTSAGFDPTYNPAPFITQADTTVFNFKLNDDFEVSKGITSSVRAYGPTAEYVRAWLIDHPNASINTILVRITDSIANHTLGEWLVKSDSLTWCDDDICEVKITLAEYIPEADCLKSTLISDNHRGWFPDSGFNGGTDNLTGNPIPDWIHPRFRYCDDIKPQALQNFLFVIAQAILIAINTVIGPIILLLQVIAAILDFIDQIADFIGFSNLGLSVGVDNLVDSLQNMLNDIRDTIFGAFLGCNRLHPSPYVRNYFENACSKCGIAFESTIFNDPASIYYNTAHLFAPVKKGILKDSNKDWIQDNHPIFNAWYYAKSLRPLFNARYRLRDGVFRFEQKNFFETGIIFDFTDAGRRELLIGKICFGWTGNQKPAYQQLLYSQDSFDTDGNEVLHRFSGIKEFNPGGANPLLTGEDVITVDGYSGQRYTNDGVDRRIIFKALGEELALLDGVLLMNADITSAAKLIIHDVVNTNRKFAESIRVNYDTYRYGIPGGAGWPDDYGNTDGNGYYVYNWPFFYAPDANTVPQYRNLYDFFKNDDPNLASKTNVSWSASMQLCTPDLIELLFTDPADSELNPKLEYCVDLGAGRIGVITDISINYEKNVIDLKGHLK